MASSTLITFIVNINANIVNGTSVCLSVYLSSVCLSVCLSVCVLSPNHGNLDRLFDFDIQGQVH